MNKLVKKIIGATSACALVLGMVLGANALAKKGGVNEVKEEKAETMVTFQYEAPSSVPDPYSQTNVQNTANWKEATDQCPPSTIQKFPCSIQVPSGNVIGTPGTSSLSATISPTVNIQTAAASSSTPNQHIVDAPAPSSGYANPVNRAQN
ncbi:hypothetical protein [Sphingobacterium faecium]|uniref:hypothetical protein n=1 Tax=Sphingobacterium faecium TaxID=34087 RepID=UPI0024691069|nr:hypothetical protein [Sphingobacterium faecium]MDH5828724.1 hypothetical protein [Sphingobacterium faecium]